MSKVLYISSEVFPLVKTGGLADVAGSLPVALLKQQQDVRVLLPAYTQVLEKIAKHKVRATLTIFDLPVTILETRLPGSNVVCWLVDCPALYQRPGGPYTNAQGKPWEDNALRFAVFCYVAVELALNHLELDWQPDVVHCNDWQTGLVPALLSLQTHKPATVFTIHNLAYQGLFDASTFTELKLPKILWHMDGLEFYGQLSFIKGGLAYADKITTVSPHYAEEILTPELGYGLDGLLQHRRADLSGILNGIDKKHWNPGSDDYLVQKYNQRSLHKKTLNKTALQAELGLVVDAEIPMFGMVSRLVEQKGLDILLASLETLVTLPLQIVILGTGEAEYELQLSNWSKQYSERIKITIGYDESLAHRIEAASDIYLMPSKFEPCGLNQLYSLCYGTLPLVTAVGGLADTVVDASEQNISNGTANGFVLKAHTAEALIASIQRALALYQQPTIWQTLQTTAMRGDYSWQSSAEQYIELYQQALTQAGQ